MDAYVYQAALLCETCANEVFDSRLTPSSDSDRYPQGPYSDGGGEANSPQHCDHCGTFLENALTTKGLAYVKSACRDYAEAMGVGKPTVVAEWSAFYGVEMPDYAAAARAAGWRGDLDSWTHPDRPGVVYESAYAACAADGVEP